VFSATREFRVALRCTPAAHRCRVIGNRNVFFYLVRLLSREAGVCSSVARATKALSFPGTSLARLPFGSSINFPPPAPATSRLPSCAGSLSRPKLQRSSVFSPSAAQHRWRVRLLPFRSPCPKSCCYACSAFSCAALLPSLTPATSPRSLSFSSASSSSSSSSSLSHSQPPERTLRLLVGAPSPAVPFPSAPFVSSWARPPLLYRRGHEAAGCHLVRRPRRGP